jgi:ABC-type arginine transport system permease subunit
MAMKCFDDSNVEPSEFTNNVFVALLLNSLHFSAIKAQVSHSSSHFLHTFTSKYVTVLHARPAMFLLRIQ